MATEEGGTEKSGGSHHAAKTDCHFGLSRDGLRRGGAMFTPGGGGEILPFGKVFSLCEIEACCRAAFFLNMRKCISHPEKQK
ncbi:hypothetical protein [Comamonas sp. GB3 AK4-5]|uniref:hypothetical protein n=1 Tax=Comamonas sp. GB3 AK4-5 TaxID=3231487 RepID=UPI00351E824B